MDIRDCIAETIKRGAHTVKCFPDSGPFDIADQILALKVEGWVVKGVDESKWPMFRFKCPRGHGSWSQRKNPNLGRGICKVCEKETDEYNAMLKEKNYNWPVSFNHGLHGTIIEDGGEWETSHPATIQEVLDGEAVRQAA